VIVRVDNRLRLQRRALTVVAQHELEERFTHKNPKYFKLKSMGFAPGAERPIIRTWRDADNGETLTLPRGGTKHVREVLAREGIRLEWEDRRAKGDPAMHGMIPSHQLELEDYQRQAIDELVRLQSAILKSGTGSGKTTMVLALLAEIQLPALVLVWSIPVLNEWRERAQKELDLDPEDVGVIQGGRQRIRPVTIAMQQTLLRAKDELWDKLVQTFGVVVLDEVQRAPARTFVEVLDRFPAKYRYGASDDHTRKDSRHFLTYDLFGHNVVEVSKQVAVQAGRTLDVEVRLVPTRFDAGWYLNQAVPNFNQLLDEMTKDEARNAQVLELAQNLVNGQHPTALFTHRVAHAVELANGLPEAQGGLMIGGAEHAAELEGTIERLRKGGASWGVGTIGAVATGTNIPALSRGIATTPVHTNRQQFQQLRGRLCRAHDGKRDAVLYVMFDELTFGRLPLVNMLRWNKVVKVWSAKRQAWLPGSEYLHDMGAEDRRRMLGALSETELAIDVAAQDPSAP
jgi:superfamily II DNA or RNA helicase